ncbi:ABC transporter permease [Roseovarius sp. MMSF_3281]|uniref:ABC transporter permease n=1 Tax=Roseovarius sp. MMSF_3281 TaxID=3046694 RepID=UPI00273DF220|nr:ABC transporter permease subunit [Roseovarius sp. MMSF_3281]
MHFFVEKPVSAFAPNPSSIKRPSRFGAIIGLFILSCALFVSAFAPIVAPFDPNVGVAPAFSSADEKFLLGTDKLGRDNLSRLTYGLRNLVWIASATALLSITIGLFASVTAMLLGGWAKNALFVLAHAFSTLPALFWGLFFGALWYTPSSLSLILAMTIPFSGRVFRFCSSETMATALESAHTASKSGSVLLWFRVTGKVMRRERAFLAAMVGIIFNAAILVDFTLSFLGLGIQPPHASLGRFFPENVHLITFGDLSPVVPFVIVIPLVLSVFILIDYVLRRTGRKLVPSIRTHGPVWDLQR